MKIKEYSLKFIGWSSFQIKSVLYEVDLDALLDHNLRMLLLGTFHRSDVSQNIKAATFDSGTRKRDEPPSNKETRDSARGPGADVQGNNAHAQKCGNSEITS